MTSAFMFWGLSAPLMLIFESYKSQACRMSGRILGALREFGQEGGGRGCDGWKRGGVGGCGTPYRWLCLGRGHLALRTISDMVPIVAPHPHVKNTPSIVPGLRKMSPSWDGLGTSNPLQCEKVLWHRPQMSTLGWGWGGGG